MSVLKQFIYTNTKTALGVWGQSAAFPPNVIRYKNDFYNSYNSSEVEKQIVSLENTDFDEVFPVKRKYSVSGDRFILLSGNYLGKGLQTARYGNRFVHIFAGDGLPNSEPVSYFERAGFFKNCLNEEEKQYSKSLKYLEDFEDTAYFCTEISENVSNFIDSAEKVEALSALMERALYVAQSETAHMVFINCGNGKLLWNWVQSILCLLPFELAKSFTFDTFFSYNRSVEWLRMRDKLIGFYSDTKFDLQKERGHEYFVYDLAQPCTQFAGEASEKFKTVIAEIFGADGGSLAGLKVYRSFINKTQGADAFDKMSKCAELSSATAAKFSSFPIEAVCNALSAGIYGEEGDVSPVLSEVVGFACGAGVDELRAVLKTFNEYLPLKAKLKQVTEEEVTKDAFVKTAAERVLSNDKIILNFISELERYLKPSVRFEKALSEEINKRINTEAETLAQGLLHGEEKSIGRYGFIGNYSPETQVTIRKNIDNLFETNGESITEEAFESGDDTVLKCALRFGYDICGTVQKFVGAYVNKNVDKLAERLVCGQSEEIFAAAKEIYPETAQLIAGKTDEIFEKEKANLAKAISAGEISSAAQKLAAFEKYGGLADINSLLLEVCKNNFAGAADWNRVLEKDEIKLSVLKYLAGNPSVKNELSQSFTAFLTSEDFANGEITIDGALEIMRGCGLQAVADAEGVFNNVVSAGAVNNAGALGFVTGYIKNLPENKHTEFCNADKKRYSSLFDAVAKNEIAGNAEVDKLLQICKIFYLLGGRVQANVTAKYVETGQLSAEKYAELLDKILPGGNYAETLNYFLQKKTKAAEYYIDLYLKSKLTESAAVAVLSECEDISAVAQAVAGTVWKCICGNGTKSAEETLNGLIAFFKTASASLKQHLLKQFILTYGVKIFTAVEVKKLSAVCADCKGGYFAAICAYGDLVQGSVVADRKTLEDIKNKNGEVWVAFLTAIADLIADGKLNSKCFGCVDGIFGKELAYAVLGRFGRYSWGKSNEKHALSFLEYFKKSNGGLECLHGYALAFVDSKNILEFLRINRGKTDAQKELKRFTEYLTFSGRDDAEHLNAFCEYIKAVAVCDDGLAQTVIYNLDLRNIALKNLIRLIDGLESVQFDAVKYLVHLRALRSVLGGKPVSEFANGKEGENTDEKLNGYFARIFAHITVCGNVGLQTAETLYSVYGDLYAEAFAEELTCASRLSSKIKGLSKVYDMLCGKCASVKEKTNNVIKYAEADEKFRVQTESIFAGN